jgi:hypothetical protein
MFNSSIKIQLPNYIRYIKRTKVVKVAEYFAKILFFFKSRTK